MSYAKIDPQPSGLQPGEIAVALDSGETVAVSVTLTPQANNAPSFLHAVARQIGTDGSAVLDASGNAVMTEFTYSLTASEANDPTAFQAVQRDCLMAVLGEPVTGALSDPIHATAIANVSIRNRIAALAIAGPADVGALL